MEALEGKVVFEYAVAILMGAGLAAACGFRVFAPLLIFAIVGRLGWFDLHSEFAWLTSDAALIVLGAAVAFETAAMYVPWVDTVLTWAATPIAIFAGAFVTVAASGQPEGVLGWAIPIIVGGATAGAVHGVTAFAKSIVTPLTGGLANPVAATLEFLASIFTAIAAILFPLLLLAIAAGFAYFAYRLFTRYANLRAAPAQVPA